MLTGEIEGGRSKCDPYWPKNIEDPLTFGAFTVTTVSVSAKADFVISKLQVRDDASGEV